MATQSLDNFRSTSFKMSKILMYWNLTWPEDVWLRKGLEMEMFLDYLKWIRSPGSVPLSILPSPPLHHPLILCFIFCPTALSTTSLTTIFLPDLKRKHFFLRASLVAEWFKKKKNLPVSAGDAGSMSLSEQSPRGRHGSPPQYSCLGNPMDREPGGL